MTNTNLIYQTLANARLLKRWIRIQLDANYANADNLPFELLSHIDPEGNTQQELGLRLRCSKQEVSRLVKKAASDGWVTMTADPADKRARRVSLTEQALKALEQGMQFYSGLEASLLDDLNPDELKQLKSATKTLTRLIKQQVDQNDKKPTDDQ
ncbi:Uncharacterised protein [BD1-7 clade bacterium]|uniref:HTH marR-type domain-containing protein n=1 Tax=BD1-7 clade bacterium TaxID=2029982 RepID=A0A5S9QDD7_9GAMM|nr:Uncharacterised protein [BD1-7 clade bacterium]